MRRIICPVHGAQNVRDIAPIGPTMTRPAMRTIIQVPWDGSLYSADPNCQHYITYAPGGGVRCIRCQGWYCA